MQHSIFYQRNLPHWQPSETLFFITYRLAGSLPVTKIADLKETYLKSKLHPDNITQEKQEALQQQYFLQFDDALDMNLNEPYWLRNNDIAQIVLDSLLFNHNKWYILWCACIMPNHVHVLLQTLKGAPTLDVILQSHKKFTALYGNRILKRTGQFWNRESYDRMIRDDKHFFHTVHYILDNPVKAGFVEKGQDWQWMYLHDKLKKEFLLGS